MRAFPEKKEKKKHLQNSLVIEQFSTVAWDTVWILKIEIGLHILFQMVFTCYLVVDLNHIHQKNYVNTNFFKQKSMIALDSICF